MRDLAQDEPQMEEEEGEEEEESEEWDQDRLDREEAERDWAERDEDEQDLYLLGLTFARSQEHMRCAHALSDCTGARARWLRTYSKFLVSQSSASTAC